MKIIRARKRALYDFKVYEEGMDVSDIEISEVDIKNGSPKKGDMIFIDPINGKMHLIPEEMFNFNYEIVYNFKP
jgi:hypothetical protein